MKIKKLIVVTAATILAILEIFSILFISTYVISFYSRHEYDIDLSLIDFDSMQFDEDCTTAYDMLMNTNRFADGPIGAAGATPDEICAFGKLLICINAKDYFIQLEQEATIEGKMYALCGLYYLDYDNYNTYIEKYLNDSTGITVMYGCIMYSMSVKELIKNDEALRLKDINDTVNKWDNRKRPKYGFSTDFYGGGTPNNVLFYTKLGRYETVTKGITIFEFKFDTSKPKRLDE